MVTKLIIILVVLVVLFIFGYLIVATIDTFYRARKNYELEIKQLEEDTRRYNLEQAQKAKELEIKEKQNTKQKEVVKASNAEQAAFLNILADPTSLFEDNGGK